MKRIGFVGAGTMGIPMISNLIRAGFSVLAYDVRREAVEEAKKRGAAAAGSSAEAARDSELVITMLPSSSDVEAAYLGPKGVLEGAPAGRLCVDMSTIDPGMSRRDADDHGGRRGEGSGGGEAGPLRHGLQHHPRGSGRERRGGEALQQPDRRRGHGGRERGVPPGRRLRGGPQGGHPGDPEVVGMLVGHATYSPGAGKTREG